MQLSPIYSAFDEGKSAGHGGISESDGISERALCFIKHEDFVAKIHAGYAKLRGCESSLFLLYYIPEQERWLINEKLLELLLTLC